MKKFVTLSTVVVCLFLLNSALAEQKTWRLRWAYFATSDLPESKPMSDMVKRVADRTKGAVKIEIYWSDSLVPIFEILDAVRTGAAEMGTWPIGAFARVEKTFASAEVPLLYNTFKGQVEAHEKILPLLNKTCEQRFNQRVLSIDPIFTLEVGCVKKTIKKLEDWKGLLVQTISPQMSAMIHALGGKATPISPTEVFESLEKGVIDATIQSVGKYTEAKLWEVCPYVTIAGLVPAAVATSVNLNALSSLPKEVQQVIIDEATQMHRERVRISLDTYENHHIRLLKQNMKEVYFLPRAERERWKVAVASYVEGLLRDMGDFGAEVKKIAEEVNKRYPYPY